jgi:putative membrane protein insertion efficiency factor
VSPLPCGPTRAGTCARWGLASFLILASLVAASIAPASDAKMKGPRAKAGHPEAAPRLETSCVALALEGGVRLYKQRISPADGGARCGFRPTCSAFGLRAVREQGPAIGVLMTADRLIRCNIWKKPGPDYTLLPNGRLYDPPSKNVVFEK